ncbi:hypothetical protein V6N11_065940 [Hibiscus sabdariffa]|uniref:BHLH domain-containing protein n=1 Tax=Hibiscus sabdariffa TaxID=183260 RepID=A0ABR2NU99_9ROSI
MNSTPMGNFIIADFSLRSLLSHQLAEFPAIPADHGSLSRTVLGAGSHTATPAARTAMADESKKRNEMEQPTCESQIISLAASTTDIRKNNRLGKGKRAREAEEIVHVRARRGQATDSHSLAERVRREKINERMSCLKDLVPGCNKTMGMAVMLEEIINYVHSLQNQVEFLSMELAAATSYDSNFESQKPQEGTYLQVAQQQQMEKWGIDRYGEQHRFHSTWPL